MIRVICSREAYIYNGYHMVKAFYPLEEIVSCVEEKASNYITVYLNGVELAAITEEQIPEGEKYDSRERKYRIDCLLYQALSALTKKRLAWGILMGVRPTKLAMAELEKGTGKEEFTARFQKDFFAAPDKAELVWRIAIREKELLGRLEKEKGYSLYIGIPFCPSVCTYCSFSSGSLSDWENSVEDYLAALCREIEAVSKMADKWRLNTIYIGGGTPTTLSAGQLERLLLTIKKGFSREFLLEYTVEAGRPDSITEEKLAVLRAYGVTRISINPQSMQQKTLDIIGRRHTVEDVFKSYYMARALGFDNINMDLIAGLPGETAEDMRNTLSQIKRLVPDSLTVHALAIKRAAMLGKNKEAFVSADIAEMIEEAAAASEKMGMSPYYLYRQKNIAGNFENVGYAKVDKAGIYNILIMEEKQSIIACGAGASTKLVFKEKVENPANKRKKTNLIRLENVKAVDAYIRRVDEMIERKGEWLWR